MIDTGITIQFPEDIYDRIASHSGLASSHFVEVKAGFIDPDFRGHIQVILHNVGHKSFHVNKYDQIAQIIIEKIASPPLKVADKVDTTSQFTKGLVSTGISIPAKEVPTYTKPMTCSQSQLYIIPPDDDSYSSHVPNVNSLRA